MNSTKRKWVPPATSPWVFAQHPDRQCHQPDSQGYRAICISCITFLTSVSRCTNAVVDQIGFQEWACINNSENLFGMANTKIAQPTNPFLRTFNNFEIAFRAGAECLQRFLVCLAFVGLQRDGRASRLRGRPTNPPTRKTSLVIFIAHVVKPDEMRAFDIPMRLTPSGVATRNQTFPKHSGRFALYQTFPKHDFGYQTSPNIFLPAIASECKER